MPIERMKEKTVAGYRGAADQMLVVTISNSIDRKTIKMENASEPSGVHTT